MVMRRLGGVALVGALAWSTADAAADTALYLRAKSLVMQRAEGHLRLCHELGGPPLQAGPWFNSSVAVTHDGHIATVTLPVRGAKRSSDVTVRVVRHGGLRSTLLYNLTGGDWDVLVMDALVGMGPGGGPISMSLLQQQAPDMAQAAATAAAMGHGECLPGVSQVPAAGQQAAGQQAAARRGGGL